VIVSAKEKRLIAECMTRGLNAGIGRSLYGYSFIARTNGQHTITLQSRNPNTNTTMWWFYQQRNSIGGGAEYLEQLEIRYDKGLPVLARQPIVLKFP
jgi:hypothetical protein